MPFLSAHWTHSHGGLFYLQQDWTQSQEPPVYLRPERLRHLQPVKALAFGLLAGYFRPTKSSSRIHFILALKDLPNDRDSVYLACPESGWGDCVGNPRWRLKQRGDKPYLSLSVEAALWSQESPFRFITGQYHWINIPQQAPNRVSDSQGNVNYQYHPQRSGHHVFAFHTHDLEWNSQLIWEYEDHSELIDIDPRPYLFELQSQAPLGVTQKKNATHFSLFAPRASAVSVGIAPYRKENAEALRIQDYRWHSLKLNKKEGLWHYRHPRSIKQACYMYRVGGINPNASTHFEGTQLIVDPYAKCVASPEGPGLILPQTKKPVDQFRPPEAQDWVISEVHIQDLLASYQASKKKAGIVRGFSMLSDWAQQEAHYLKSLGVNAVELLPIMAFERPQDGDYHWGYMTVNFFSPAPPYGTDPKKVVEEVQQMVRAFHDAGIAVILDVVYNHTGSPNSLLFCDKTHYFRTTQDHYLYNDSGCGNDLRAEAPMAKRLIIDSLIHWIDTYGVDGFRFDLAELLTPEVLQEIQTRIQAHKSNIKLIAEPWSFRAHLGNRLKASDYGVWNDGYRDFMADYVLGKGNQEGIQYYLSGSPHLVNEPYKSIHYTQSHDDHAWIDRITEAADHNGAAPTLKDLKRSHLMFACLMTALGTPMIAMGQDYLHSKQGVANTYMRGDLNALDASRWLEFSNLHTYVCKWIRLRQSPLCKALRPSKRPESSFIRFFHPPHLSSTAALYNANHELPDAPRLLFAINPHLEEAPIGLQGLDLSSFRFVADTHRVNPRGLPLPHFSIQGDLLSLPPLTCGFWIELNN